MERVLAEPFVANDLAMGDGGRAPARPHRPQHGRQVDLPAPDGPDRADGPDGQLRPGARGQARPRRPHLHPGGGQRPDPARPVAPSWWRCRRPPTSCATPPRAAWSCSTRSAAAPPPSTACRSPGRWPSTSPGAEAGPKTIFATHYHELVDLAADIPGVGNLHVSAREWKDSVVFLRKIEPGGSDRSFGIQVARLAGLPASVVVRAQEILRNLESTEFDREGRPRLAHSDERRPRRGPAARPLLGPGRGGPRGAAAGRPRPADAPPGARPARRAARSGSRAELDSAMPLRRDPLQELLDLQERMNRLFDETLARERLDEPGPAPRLLGAARRRGRDRRRRTSWSSSCPGSPATTSWSRPTGDELVVRGERRPDPVPPAESFHRLERRYGPFARGFRFAEEVDPDRIDGASSRTGCCGSTCRRRAPRDDPGARANATA